MPKAVRLVERKMPQQVRILVAAAPYVQRCAARHHRGTNGTSHILLYHVLAVPDFQARRQRSTSTVPGACATRSTACARMGLGLGSPRGLALPGYLRICGAALLDRGGRLEGA